MVLVRNVKAKSETAEIKIVMMVVRVCVVFVDVFVENIQRTKQLLAVFYLMTWMNEIQLLVQHYQQELA